MNFLHLAFYLFLCIILMPAYATPLNAQDISRVEDNVKVQIDFLGARAVVDLMKLNRVSDSKLDNVANLKGNQQLIEKVTGNNSKESADIFKKTLRQVIENRKIAEDPFDWQSVKKNLFQIRALTDKIEKNKPALLADIKKLIQPYTPNNVKGSVTAVFIVGGGSLGFTLDNNSNFYVALQKIGNDYEGLKYIVAHELYHSIQELGRQKRLTDRTDVKMPDSIRNSLVIIRSTYTEGTATLVGDLQNAKNLKQLGQLQKNEFAKNLARSRLNSSLLEALLFQAYNDPNADVDRIYRIGFSTAYDETLYYVGYRMAQAIEKYKGKQAVAALINKSPVEFFNLYIELYKMHEDDSSLIKFNKSTEQILSKLQEWKDKT